MEASVLVELKAKNLDFPFCYHIPKKFEEKVKKGVRVLVPFSHQKLEGFVLEIKEDGMGEVKEILDVIDEFPVLNEEMLELGTYISKKTFSTLISAYQTMLPKALKVHHDVVVPKKYHSMILISQEAELKGKQKELYEEIKKRGEMEKKEANSISSYALKVLLEKGILKEEKKEVYRLETEEQEKELPLPLTLKQQSVVDTVSSSLNTFHPFLLFGVTGSGKTEVYMHIIEKVLKEGKETIVLVPEISLTPQMVHHFKRRFGSEVAILHSRLSDGEKYDEWRKIERKEVHIAVGARSAIFAPFTNLGCIIIDEEHSATYKQENSPRYHAIDVAIKRAKYHDCPLILGSATPSIESYTRAMANIYTLLELKERIHQGMPKVEIVDMQKEMKQGNRILSSTLKEKMLSCFEKKEQVILLLNRRGYSTIVTCKSCGYVDTCPNCEIPLIYHKDSNTMRCHYCGYGNRKLVECPKCHSKNINEYGMGTQKLEEYVKNTFPHARVLRMDMDTTSKKGAHEKITTSFEKGEYDILLGTQMIAKGLDFPNVTLVGVLNADTTLEIPDFRSSERTFELLSQVAGRAGRSTKEGEVIFQCFNTNHYSILCASHHDYQTFYQKEMEIRKKLKYPPYCNLSLVRIQGKKLEQVEEEAKKIAAYLKQKENLVVLGPSPSNMAKINQKYFYQIIVKYKNRKEVYESFLFLKNQYQKNLNVFVEIEESPLKF